MHASDFPQQTCMHRSHGRLHSFAVNFWEMKSLSIKHVLNLCGEERFSPPESYSTAGPPLSPSLASYRFVFHSDLPAPLLPTPPVAENITPPHHTTHSDRPAAQPPDATPHHSRSLHITSRHHFTASVDPLLSPPLIDHRHPLPPHRPSRSANTRNIPFLCGSTRFHPRLFSGRRLLGSLRVWCLLCDCYVIAM